MDVSQRRQFTQDLNRQSGSFELAVAVVLFGGIGFLVDRWLGILPVLTITFVVLGAVGVAVRLWAGYDREMQRHEESGPWAPLLTADSGAAPEPRLALDMVRRAAPILPLVIVVAMVARGTDGVASALYAVAIVVANLLVSAFLLAWAARVSLGLLMAVALFGFLVRLGLIFVAVLVVKDAPWMDVWSLGITLVVTHLGLLFWELRFVSLSLAHPGVAPSRRPVRPANPATVGADRR